MFCRGCGYDLRTLGAGKCPECGRAFDPLDRRTFFAKKPRLGLRRWAKRLGIVAAVLGVIVGGLGTWFLVWRGRMVAEWEREQAIEGNLRESGDACYWEECVGANWIRKLLHPRYTRRIHRVSVDRRLTKEKGTLISSLPYIQVADFGESECEEGAISALRGKTSLKRLRIPKNVSDAEMAMLDLSSLTGMEQFSLLTATDKAIRGVGKLTRIKVLALSGIGVTDKGIREIAELSCLETLVLSSTGVTDEGLGVLRQLTRLKQLDLSRCASVTDTWHLRESVSLEELNLQSTKIDDRGVTHLLGLGNLKVLNLEGTLVTDACIGDLAQMKSLRIVRLEMKRFDSPGITEFGASALRRMRPDLKVYVSGPYGI